MIKFYYVSITDRNLYIDDINLLEYLNNYFPNVYSSYQNIFNRDKVINIDKYKEDKNLEYFLIENSKKKDYLFIY